MIKAVTSIRSVSLLTVGGKGMIGVPGIALSMTLAAAVTAGLMLLLFCRLGDVAWVDMTFIMANWILYLALAVCLHYESYPGAIAAGVAFAFLVLGEWALAVRPHAHGEAAP